MGRPKQAVHRDKPVVIRLTPSEYRLLKASAFVEQRPEAACARGALVHWLNQQATTSSVKRALEALEIHDMTEANTHSLAEARERQPKRAAGNAQDEEGSAG